MREEAICAKVYRQTDGQTDDGRLAIALAHSWNELIKTYQLTQEIQEGRQTSAVGQHPSLVSIVYVPSDKFVHL